MKNKAILLSVLSLFIYINSHSQDQFTVQIEPLVISNAPSVHSFSWGKTSDGKWVILGGRIDGLHQRHAGRKIGGVSPRVWCSLCWRSVWTSRQHPLHRL